LILSIGEILWDDFGEYRILGGAPLNVASYLNRMGTAVSLISRIGNDQPGRDILTKLSELGLSADYIQTDQNLPTGKVLVSLNRNNEPDYEIIEPAAWDNIEYREIAGEYSIVFGTLAQRNRKSRETIAKLLKKSAARFYDVNLRFPFTTRENVLNSLEEADIVKLNNQELEYLCGWLGTGYNAEESAFRVFKEFGLAALAVTLGSNGAYLVTGNNIFRHPGFPAKVVDTVGAGDAFFAALITGYLNKRPWPEVLESANKNGSAAVSRKGAV
jgi:fructokinase